MKTATRIVLFPACIAWSAGCFPTEEFVYEGPDTVEEIPIDETPVASTSVDAALEASAPEDPTVECPSLEMGLAAQTAGLTASDRLGVGTSELSVAPDLAYLQDDWRLAVMDVARDRPLSVGWLEGALADPLATATSEGDLGAMIRHAAELLGDSAWKPTSGARGDYAAAVAAICARYPEQTCGAGEGTLPDGFEAAFAPLMWAIHDGVVARLELDALLEVRTPSFWRDHGGKNLFPTTVPEGYNSTFAEDKNYLTAARGKLHGAAAVIADAVRALDTSAFVGQTGVGYALSTPAGFIKVRGAEADSYEEDFGPVLLLVDLGGDDTHYDQVASNVGGDNPVSVVLDLGGADTYSYPEATSADLAAARLPLDGDGSVVLDGRVNGASASEVGRQGAARNGIAMLFDLGDGADTYVALRGSQGYAHQGVGVLFDAGGADTYVAEDGAQGAAQFGIALAVDLGAEADVRRSSHASQGFGYTAGVGILVDQAGSDTYACHPDHDGKPAYYAPQLPGTANASMCQGAGLGFRIKDADYTQAGGVGVLLDLEGDDSYEAGVYAQGVGYWQGFGLLSDRAGSDLYDAMYYAQGAAAHYGVGYFADGGAGDDGFGTRLTGETMMLGAAQDFAVGVFVNEAGDDTYQIYGRGAAVASCGSVAVFVDNAGADSYAAPSVQAAGVALSDACGEAVDPLSTAVLVDVGGDDTWVVPGGSHANGASWGTSVGVATAARAFAVDVASGDSGVHVGDAVSSAP